MPQQKQKRSRTTRRPHHTKPPSGILEGVWFHIKRNKLKYISLSVTIFLGLPTAAASYNNYIEPNVPAFRYWVRDQLQPLLLVQNTQARSIDRFLLYQQQEALVKAQTDPAAKSSPVVQERIRDLQQQVQDTEARISKTK